MTECIVYRSAKREETYLYLEASRSLDELPEELSVSFGRAIEVMRLGLKPETRLAIADTATVLAALVTYATVKLLGNVILLYGRRTMVFSVLAGFLFGYLTRYLLVFNAAADLGVDATLLQSIGYIIPGLIANWFERQGILRTIDLSRQKLNMDVLDIVQFHGAPRSSDDRAAAYEALPESMKEKLDGLKALYAR